jgi:hypothetical protein
MDNRDKAQAIRTWVNPEERVTVDFEDERNLNAEVTACNEEVVELALETAFPHLRQEVSIPLGHIEIGEDRGKYTRDPDQPARYGRLRLMVQERRPQVL